MNGNDNYENASDALNRHLSLIDTFIETTQCDHSTFKDEFLEYANLNKDEVSRMSQSELFDAAYILYSYANYLQEFINREKVILEWCNNQMDLLIAKHQNDFGQYTKHESKRPLLVIDNLYAEKVDSLRLVSLARLQTLEGKTFDIKKQGDVLLEKAKRK